MKVKRLFLQVLFCHGLISVQGMDNRTSSSLGGQGQSPLVGYASGTLVSSQYTGLVLVSPYDISLLRYHF